MRAASAHALNDGLKRHVNFQHVINLDAGRFHGVSLRNGPGETVKQKALGAICLGNALFNQVDDQVIADQATGVHDFFGLHAQRGSGLDSGAQHVTGGDLRNAVFLANEGGLCAFASAWGAQ